jgi:hypothetical protein
LLGLYRGSGGVVFRGFEILGDYPSQERWTIKSPALKAYSSCKGGTILFLYSKITKIFTKWLEKIVQSCHIGACAYNISSLDQRCNR